MAKEEHRELAGSKCWRCCFPADATSEEGPRRCLCLPCLPQKLSKLPCSCGENGGGGECWTPSRHPDSGLDHTHASDCKSFRRSRRGGHSMYCRIATMCPVSSPSRARLEPFDTVAVATPNGSDGEWVGMLYTPAWLCSCCHLSEREMSSWVSLGPLWPACDRLSMTRCLFCPFRSGGFTS